MDCDTCQEAHKVMTKAGELVEVDVPYSINRMLNVGRQKLAPLDPRIDLIP